VQETNALYEASMMFGEDYLGKLTSNLRYQSEASSMVAAAQRDAAARVAAATASERDALEAQGVAEARRDVALSELEMLKVSGVGCVYVCLSGPLQGLIPAVAATAALPRLAHSGAALSLYECVAVKVLWELNLDIPARPRHTPLPRTSDTPQAYNTHHTIHPTPHTPHTGPSAIHTAVTHGCTAYMDTP
jgi:hypothetical protein